MSFYVRPLKKPTHLLKILNYLGTNLITPQKNYSTCERKLYLNPKEKVALITGGTGSIGVAITRELLCNEVKHVFLVDICKDLEIINNFSCEFGPDTVSLIQCDVNNRVEMEDCFRKVICEVDKLDIIINAAGIFNGRLWEEEMQTNLLTTVSNNIIGQKYVEKCGVILNLCGLQGLEPLPPSPTLSAGFSGVVALSKSIGHPNNPRKNSIRIVALCTGITQGNFSKGASNRQINPEMGEGLETFLKNCIRQKDEHCAKAALHVLQHAESGTIWAVNGGILYSINFPPWHKYSHLEYRYY